MALSCDEATRQYVATLSDGFRCAPLGGRLRVITPYPYPDNDYVQVFVEELTAERVRVTDLGETARHLYGLGLDLDSSRKRITLAETIAAGSDVLFQRGQLMKEGHVSEIGGLMFDVIVAARGVADLILTTRAYETATFREEVANLFEQNDIRYEPRPKLVGESGRTYTVDFLVRDIEQYVQALSPSQPGGLQAVVNRGFRIWSDVNGQIVPRRKLTLLNDVDFRWQEADVALLQRVSTVARWSQQDELITMLSGAA